MSELHLNLLCIPPVLVTSLHGHLGEVFFYNLDTRRYSLGFSLKTG